MNYLMRNHRLLAAATLFTLATATQVAPAQDQVPAQIEAQEHQVSTVMIIRCGPTDIILNSPLLQVLLSEPATVGNLKKQFGDDFKRIEKIFVNMPEAHGAGTFQVHVYCTISLAGEWNEERREKATKVFVGHLRDRLDDILYESPLTRLSERRDMLRNQHLNSSRRLMEANAQVEQTKQLESAANRQLAGLTEQLLAAKLAVVTEEHVRKHLAKAREENVAMRNHLRKSSKKNQREHYELNNELLALVQQRAAATDKAVSGKLSAKITRLQGQLDQVANGTAQSAELTADVQNMLTIILEQLPTCELTLQRARAQLSSLQESIQELSARRAQARQRAAKNAKHGIRAAHLQIDNQVTREQLLDVEAKLARIRPVRYEVLQPR